MVPCAKCFRATGRDIDPDKFPKAVVFCGFCNITLAGPMKLKSADGPAHDWKGRK